MKALYLLLPVLLTGCSVMSITEERQVVSSGHIGCSPKEIAISDNQSYTWTASCKGKVFYCTVAPSASCQEQAK